MVHRGKLYEETMGIIWYNIVDHLHLACHPTHADFSTPLAHLKAAAWSDHDLDTTSRIAPKPSLAVQHSSVMAPTSIIPSIPGTEIHDPAIRSFLNQAIGRLCSLSHSSFPGAQPVSFTSDSLELLQSKDFWVCEKSDGVRVLMLILWNQLNQDQDVFFVRASTLPYVFGLLCYATRESDRSRQVDRKQRYFQIRGLVFPHWEDASTVLVDTLIDGELVMDVDPKTGAQKLCYYAFDCLVLHGDNIMPKPMTSRYGVGSNDSPDGVLIDRG